MKNYKVKHDIQRLLFKDEPPARKQRLRERIVDYALKSPPQAQAQHLEEVALCLEQIYWPHPDTRPASAELLRALAKAILTHKRLPLFFAIYQAMAENPERIDAQQLALNRGRYSPSEMRVAALMWFVLAFFRQVGENTASSIQFALFILEQCAILVELVKDPAMPLDEQATRAKLGGLAYRLILESATAPPSTNTPSKYWIERLIEATETDRAAEEVLKSVLAIMVLGDPENRFRWTTLRDSREAVSAVMSARLSVGIDGLAQDPLLLVSAQNRARFKLWQERIQAESRRDKEKGERALEWFRTNQTAILEDTEKKLRGVTEQARRWFRPRGHDHVEIAVTPLNTAGIRAVVFRPENNTFPDVGIEVLVRKETPRLITFPTSLADLPTLPLAALENVTHPDLPELRLLLMAVVADIMYRIAVEGDELRTHRRWQKVGSDTSPLAEPTIGVRPHIRRLPIGWQASAMAQARVETEWGIKLPLGVTFVSAHYRAGQLVYDLPTEPVAVYGDDDLFGMREQP